MKAAETSKGVLSLMERLSLAHEEAKLESELEAQQSVMKEEGPSRAKCSKLKAVDRRLGTGLKALRRVAETELARRSLEPIIAQPIKQAQETMSMFMRALYPMQIEAGDVERWYDEGDAEEEGEEEEYEEDPIRKREIPLAKTGEDQNPVLQLLENPLTRDLSRFRNKLRDEGVVLRRIKRASALVDNGEPSFYGAEDSSKAIAKNRRSAKTKEAERDYVLQLSAEAKQKRVAEELLAKEMQDDKEMQIGRVRAIRLAVLSEKREAKKEAMVQSSILRARFQEDEKKRSAKERAQRKKEALVLRELQETERVRILEIRREKKHAKKEDDVERRERDALEKVRLRGMADRKEFDEIVRRNMEEERMRYLEGRRKLVEDRDLLLAERKKKALEARRKEFRAMRDQFVGKVRMGSFWYHSGRYGFYNDVRATPVSWMQYEDEHGAPYYWDPLTNKTQRERPSDAPIRHFLDDERDAHDAVHGQGSYDDMVADKAYKDAVNANGGWWDAEGNWVLAHGSYDANYEWVPFEGYYNESGEYVRYAKVSGNLSFMV